jgi:cobaltochelatase CobS
MALIKHSERTIRKPCQGCGSKELYWAHDTDREGQGFHCERHSSSGKMTLMELDGSRHNCRGRNASGTLETPRETPASPTAGPVAPETAQVVTAALNGAAVPGSDKAAMVAQLLDALAPQVDVNTVKAMVTEQHGSFSAELLSKVDAKISAITAPVKLEITQPNGETVKIDGAHKTLPTVVKVVGQARKHCLMVGPAGTGKSTIAEQVAESLGLSYYSISLSPQTPASALLGYMQAAGEYVRSLYREAYEHGGVFHFDEFDNAHPSVLAVINASLANGHMAFPDRMVTRHPDFRVCASANTYGRGPDRQYVGRQAIDAATLDRFVVVTVDIDEALESKICQATGAGTAVVTEVLRYVRAIRNASEQGRKALIFSPRASEGVCALLMAGISAREAVEMRVRRGISDADWNAVTSGVPPLHVPAM